STTARSSTRSTRRPSQRAAATTGRPVYESTTTRRTTRRSCSTPTTTTSRSCATALLLDRHHEAENVVLTLGDDALRVVLADLRPEDVRAGLAEDDDGVRPHLGQPGALDRELRPRELDDRVRHDVVVGESQRRAPH